MKKRLQGTVNLPGSKSESNRALMIAAYGGFESAIDNLSEAHDTVLLQQQLKRIETADPDEPFTVDCEDAGSVARFLMTYLAAKPGTWILTGTDRLCERPMEPLVNALRQLGAKVECIEKEGALPVCIRGVELMGGRVTLDASQSSQFASSLLMAAPTWERGLRLSLEGDPVSLPYLEMTLKMMAYFGVQTACEGNVITVAHQPYQQRHFTVSADWSAASYWYEMLALSEGGDLLLKGLKTDSIQGDAAVADLFKPLGVNTEQVKEGVRVSSDGFAKGIEKPLRFDLSNTPDLFPSIFVSCVALHIKSEFIGITTLYNKESNRVNSLISELSKKYTFINILSYDKLVIEESSYRENVFDNGKIIFKTYQDHRLAMAMAGLFLVFSDFSIDNHDVVNKSYPTFWNDVNKIITT